VGPHPPLSSTTQVKSFQARGGSSSGTTPTVGPQPPRPGLSTEPSLKGRVQPPDDEGARGKRARRPSMVAAAAAESSGVRGDVLHPIADEKNGASG
jgi:hypothetical protein